MAEKKHKMTDMIDARYALEYMGEELVATPRGYGSKSGTVYDWWLSKSGFGVDRRDAEKLRASPHMEQRPSALRDELRYGWKP